MSGKSRTKYDDIVVIGLGRIFFNSRDPRCRLTYRYQDSDVMLPHLYGAIPLCCHAVAT